MIVFSTIADADFGKRKQPRHIIICCGRRVGGWALQENARRSRSHIQRLLELMRICVVICYILDVMEELSCVVDDASDELRMEFHRDRDFAEETGLLVEPDGTVIHDPFESRWAGFFLYIV